MPRRIKKFTKYDLLSEMEINSLTLNQKAYDQASGLYAWFRFENDITGGGNAHDSSGNSRDLASTGLKRPSFINESPSSVPTVENFSKHCYGFVDDVQTVLTAEYPSLFEFNTTGASKPQHAFSISTWVKFDDLSSGDDQIIVAKYNPGAYAEQQYLLELDGGGRNIMFKIFNGVGGQLAIQASDLPLVSGSWHHIVATFSGTPSPGSGASSGIMIYVNGTPTAQASSYAGPGTPFSYIPNSNALFSVGNQYNKPTNTDFVGVISEVAIWNAELSVENVQVLYNFKDTIAYRFSSGFVNLPPRVLLRQQDNATGSYPTVMRVGDRDRTGVYNRSFEDNYTINFGRKIKDNFELKNREGGGILGFSKDIDTSRWTHSSGMEIRQELLVGDAGTTSGDTAIVFSGKGTDGSRWLQTKDKVKNPRVKIDLTIGPYNEDRTVLKFGLGLTSGTATDVLKIQASTNGSSPWTDIKTIQNNVSSILSDSFVRDFRSESFIKRKRVQVDLHPADFPFGNDDFYLRIVQESVSSTDVAVWAIGKIEIDYHNEENISYPLMIDVDTFVGQKIVSASVTAPHLNPTLKGPGRSLAGISDVHLSFTPGEGISAFNDNSHFFNDTSQFFKQGTDPAVLPGFSSPVSNKTIIEVDLSPSEQTTFGLDTRATLDSTGTAGAQRGPRLETDDTKKQQLMVYWNKNLRRWEKIAQGISGNAAAEDGEGYTPLKNMIHSGALGFSGIGMCSTGSDTSLASQVPVNQDALLSYVRPTSTFGFPFEGKYEATASQFIKASDLGITKPFLLEKCSINFDSKFEFASDNFDSGSRAYSLAGAYPHSTSDPSSRTLVDNQKVYIPTFFMLRQSKEIASITYEYEIEGLGVRLPQKRTVVIPDPAVHLSTDTDLASITSVENSRELITYGQMTMFVSGTANVGSESGQGVVGAQVDIDKIIKNGLGRDTIVNILSATGQSNFNISDNIQLSPITGTFNIDFPCRLSPKINNTCQTILIVSKSTTNTVGALMLGNTLGGRGDGTLESTARSLVNGYGSTSLGTKFLHFSQDSSKPPIEISPPSAATIDIASPYVIMPDDELVFGWQYPATTRIVNAAPGKSDSFLNTMSLYGKSKLRLIGSLIKNNKEYHEGLNQNLSSDAIHEKIGAETPIDQFQVSKQGANKGNFYDTGITLTGASTPVARIGSETFSKITTLVSNAGKAAGYVKLASPYFQTTVGTTNLGLAIGQIIGLTGSDGTEYAAEAAAATNLTTKTFQLFGDADDYGTAWFTLSALEAVVLSFGPGAFQTELETSYTSAAMWSVKLNITQNVGGFAGNRLISFETNSSARRFSAISAMSGGQPAGKITRGNSFARNTQLTDAVRIYTDSTGSTGAFNKASTFGLLQTNSGVSPKYYFNSKKYGHFSDFMDQGKDSKFSQVVGKLLQDFKGSALQAPVEIKFVSGTNEDTIGVKRFVGKPPVFSENKTTTSALTSSFELPV